MTLATYAISGSVEPGVVFLRQTGRTRHWAERSDSELSDLVLDAFGRAGGDELLALVNEEETPDLAALRLAWKFVTQWRVSLWIAAQNRKTISPASSLVLDRFEALRLEAPPTARPPPWGTSDSSTARMKVFRLRKTYHGRWGRFAARDDLPVADMVERCTAVWQWWNYCCGEIQAGKRPLRINMDETAVCLFQGKGPGNIFIAPSTEIVQNVPRSVRRTHLTHVAFVCDDVRVQPALPQVVIANERTVTARQFGELQARCPPNVRLLRGKTAWNSASTCARIIGWLAAAIAPFTSELQPLLLLDAVRLHYTGAVLRACCRVRIWPVIVPAKLTWMLQPSDMHVFARYKVVLQRKHQAARCATPDGVVGVLELLDCIYGAIRDVLDAHPWAGAFDHNGFSLYQTNVSDKILQRLQLRAPMLVGSDQPSLNALQAVFPRRTRVPVEQLWRPLRARPLAPATATAMPVAPYEAPLPSEPCDAIAYRTRAGLRRRSWAQPHA